MTALLAVAVGAAGVAAGSWLVGWVALPVVGAVVGAWLGWAARRDRPGGREGALEPVHSWTPAARRWAPAATAALAGAVGWGALLLLAAARGPVAQVARLVGGVLGGIPGPAFFLVVLLFAGLLAGAAGGASAALVQLAGSTKSSFHRAKATPAAK